MTNAASTRENETHGAHRKSARAGKQSWLLCVALGLAGACDSGDAPLGADRDVDDVGVDAGANEPGPDGDDEPLPPLPDDVGVPEQPLPAEKPEHLLLRASKSGTIDISKDDRVIAMVLPDEDALAIFASDDERLLARVATGDEPSAVVLHPDARTAFVANRAAASVVRVDGIDGAAPVVSAPVPVGSEPTGLALSPGGTYLYVAEHAEGRVSVFRTKTMELVGVIAAPDHPYALAVTNDGDDDEGDELLVVPEFFGEQREDRTSTRLNSRH